LQTARMRGLALPYPDPKKILWRLFTAMALILALSWSLLADTPIGPLKTQDSETCYCHCAKTKGVRSCVKMCELPKYASRRGAICSRKQVHNTSRENPGAGAHLKHRYRAEHAQL